MRRVSGNAQGPNTIKRCNQGSTTTTHKRSRRSISQRLTIRRQDKPRKLWHLQTGNRKRHKTHRRHKKDFSEGAVRVLLPVLGASYFRFSGKSKSAPH